MTTPRVPCGKCNGRCCVAFTSRYEGDVFGETQNLEHQAAGAWRHHCRDCEDGTVLADCYAAFFVDQLLGGPKLTTPVMAMPTDPAVLPSVAAALAHWLDSLPNSPQGANVATRLHKLAGQRVARKWRWCREFAEPDSWVLGKLPFPGDTVVATVTLRKHEGKEFWCMGASDKHGLWDPAERETAHETLSAAKRAAEARLGLPFVESEEL